MKYLAEYGDYLAENWRDFRQAATRSKNPEINRFCDNQTWTEVQNESDEVGKELAIWMKQCEELGLDEKNIFFWISRYPGLPKTEIAGISTNKLRPQKLFKLRHLQG